MEDRGQFSIAGECFRYELHKRTPFQIKVQLKRDSDGLSRAVLLFPHAHAFRDLCGFVRDRLNFELTRTRFEDLPN